MSDLANPGPSDVHEWCEKHRHWFVPHSQTEPCPGCRTEAEAHWAECEDHNIRALLEMP